MRLNQHSTEAMVVAQWTRLGASFAVAASEEPPDLERLLLDTARLGAGNSRLLTMGATWLAEYSSYVAKRRLAVLVREELEMEFRPVMGLLLEWVQENGRRDRHRFREVIAECQPAAVVGPLLKVMNRGPVLRELAQRQATALSRKWGVWIEEFELKEDALRPVEWVAEKNPSLAIRALCGGDLVATIAADAEAGDNSGGVGGVDFASESALARRYGASRAAVRDALLKLKLAGFARQQNRGKSRAVVWKGGLFL